MPERQAPEQPTTSGLAEDSVADAVAEGEGAPVGIEAGGAGWTVAGPTISESAAAAGEVSADEARTPAATDLSAAPAARTAARRRARPDAVLIEARDDARAALADIARDDQIGEHRGATVDGDRLVTHTFASLLPGYVGWNWFAVLARAPRSRAVTVCEIGLAPGEGSLLAPPWVPWADRLRPEDHQDQDQADQSGQDRPDQDRQSGDGEATTTPDDPDAGAAPAVSDADPVVDHVGTAPEDAARATAPAAAAPHPREDHPAGAGETGPDEDHIEIVDDDAAVLARPDADGQALPGEEGDDPEPDLSAEAERVRTEEETEDAVADGAEEATGR